ncbi:MAG: RDD family protein [Cytophagales bacterium]|nr:MAG: RDD family protein [Cytophagales bacterium]
MKNIEINTPQNVVIKYTLTSVWERAIAFGIDAFIIFLTSIILWFFFNSISTIIVGIVTLILILPLVLFYNLLFEYFNNGQSIGKKLLKIRVIRIDGESAGFKDYFMRWIFRGLDLYFSIGGLALLSSLCSANSQRIGDILAGTVVVNINHNNRLKFENLLKLDKMDTHIVSYPQVSKLSETSILTIKETIIRYGKFNNEAHQSAINILVKKLSFDMKIKRPKDKINFLKTIIKDYVFLTR